MKAGDVFVIETPGGGGFGKAELIARATPLSQSVPLAFSSAVMPGEGRPSTSLPAGDASRD